MRKVTQSEFDNAPRNEYGYKVFGDDLDFTEVYFHGEDKISIGDRAWFGIEAKFGDEAEFGDLARFGDRARFGDVASFENGSVKNGKYITVGNIGRENRTAYFYIDGDGKIFVRAGCWFSDDTAFVERVKSVHAGTIYEKQYIAAMEYAKAILPLMIAKDDKKGETT